METQENKTYQNPSVWTFRPFLTRIFAGMVPRCATQRKESASSDLKDQTGREQLRDNWEHTFISSQILTQIGQQNYFSGKLAAASAMCPTWIPCRGTWWKYEDLLVKNHGRGKSKPTKTNSRRCSREEVMSIMIMIQWYDTQVVLTGETPRIMMMMMMTMVMMMMMITTMTMTEWQWHTHPGGVLEETRRRRWVLASRRFSARGGRLMRWGLAHHHTICSVFYEDDGINYDCDN